jgi:hypothetical protein
MLNDMLTTMHAMYIKLKKLQCLIKHWETMTNNMFSQLLYIKVEIIIHTHMVINGCRLYIELNLLWTGGLENAWVSLLVLGHMFWTKIYISITSTYQHLQ